MIQTKRKHFLIKSENYEKLRPVFEETAETIKKAIAEKRHILIKHHDDVDGYASGIVLEKAIFPLIQEIKKHYYFSRHSSRSPYYDYIDSLRDLNNFMGSYNTKPPLVILTDLGSNNQSLKSINRLKDYGFDFIIVDHHLFDKENKEAAKHFLNPREFNFEINAGSLATELALFINPLLTNIKHLPALSAVADKSSGKEAQDYIKISGHTRKELEAWGIALDHELYYLRFPARTKLLADLFFPKNLILINSMYKEIKQEFEKIKCSVKRYVKIKQYKKFKLLTIEKDKIGDWKYASSKITRITNDLEQGPRITFALSRDLISYRADKVKFNGIDLIEDLKEKLPHALISGGGHDVAGAIKFNEISKEEVLNYINKYLEKL